MNSRTTGLGFFSLHFSSPQEHCELVDVSGGFLYYWGKDGSGRGSNLRHCERRGRRIRVALLFAVFGESRTKEERVTLRGRRLARGRVRSRRSRTRTLDDDCGRRSGGGLVRLTLATKGFHNGGVRGFSSGRRRRRRGRRGVLCRRSQLLFLDCDDGRWDGRGRIVRASGCVGWCTGSFSRGLDGRG